jgi:ribosomal protein L16 Arg81 hydroxylase
MTKGGHSIPRDEYSIVRQDGLVDFNVEQVLKLYADGATITINRAHQCSAELASLCVDLSKEFQAHVNANVYITPPNAQGFAVHSDTHDVILVQGEGRKRWKMQQTLEYLATPRNPNVTSDPVTAGPWDEFYLAVGDSVYIPRGLLHEGISDDSHSLHITLGIHPYTWADLFRDVLAKAESTDSALRQAVTPSPMDFETALRTFKSRLMDSLSCPHSTQSLLLERTRRYQDGSFRGKFRELTDPNRITLATTVRVRKGIDIRFENNHHEIVLSFGTKSLALPRYVSEHLRRIVESESISAEELPSDLDDDGKLTLLRRLLTEGLVDICTSTGDSISSSKH